MDLKQFQQRHDDVARRNKGLPEIIRSLVVDVPQAVSPEILARYSAGASAAATSAQNIYGPGRVQQIRDDDGILWVCLISD